MDVVVYTDGALIHQTPRSGSAFVADLSDVGLIVEHLRGGDYATNNQAELGGVIAALRFFRALQSGSSVFPLLIGTRRSFDDGMHAGPAEAAKTSVGLSAESLRLLIYSDSRYVVEGIEEWVWTWSSAGWRTRMGGVPENRELWGSVLSLLQGVDVECHHVKGHSGVIGNERADRLARRASKRRVPPVALRCSAKKGALDTRGQWIAYKTAEWCTFGGVGTP